MAEQHGFVSQPVYRLYSGKTQYYRAIQAPEASVHREQLLGEQFDSEMARRMKKAIRSDEMTYFRIHLPI